MDLSRVPSEELLAELARRLHAPIALPPLTGYALEAAEFIIAHPGEKGRRIADAIGCHFGHFRRSISHKLLARGFRSGRGCFAGYYPPAM